jgi:uncharacterized membrane protein YjfL (UPF0719 family)
MSQFLIWNGLFSLTLGLLLGVLAIYVGFNAFKRLNPQVDEEFELRNNNIAVALVSGSFILSLGILMQGVIDPITQTLFNLYYQYQQFGVSYGDVFTSLALVLLQFSSALVLSLATLILGTRLYMNLNRQTDELSEIANNNIAVATVVAAITVTLALLISSGMETFLDAIVPAPESLNRNLPY